MWVWLYYWKVNCFGCWYLNVRNWRIRRFVWGGLMSDYLIMVELENSMLKDIYVYVKEFKIFYYS